MDLSLTHDTLPVRNRLAPLRRLFTRDWLPVLVFLVSLAIYVFMTDNLIAKVRFPTGDEPYYLLMAHSLLHDHDLELTNNFAERDYWDYYPGELYPRHESKTVRPGLWSKHAPGVAALIVPGYALAGWRGGALTMSLLAALLASNIYLLGREASGRRSLGLFAWLTLSFTNPLASYASLIFPATPAALFTIYAFRQIRNGRVPGDPWRTLGAALCTAALPWLNPQLLPLAAGLAIYALGTLGPREPVSGNWHKAAHAWGRAWASHGRAWLAALLPLVILASLYLGYYYYLYETILPNWQDHAGSSDLAGTFIGLIGSFLDQQWGLLIHAPLLLLAFSGMMLMWQRDRRELGWLTVVSLPYFLLIINYKQWWGEWCPAARYLVPLVPLLALPLVRASRALRRWRFLLAYLPLAAGSYGVMAAFVLDPHLMYNHPVGQSNLLLWLAGQGWPDLTHVVPTFFIADEMQRNLALAAVWALAAVGMVMWGWRSAQADDQPPPQRHG